MTPADVRKRVAAIAQVAEDDEKAHGMQDRLFSDVLRAIADGECERPKAVAAETLKVIDLDFSRWTA